MKINKKLLSISLKVIACLILISGSLVAIHYVRENDLPALQGNNKAITQDPLNEEMRGKTELPTMKPITPQPPTLNQTPMVLENDWVLYSDPDLEFSFAYPATAHISSGKNPVDLSKNVSLQFAIPDKPFQGMSIRVELNPKRLQAGEIAVNLYEVSTQKQAPSDFANSIKPFSVDGLYAVQTYIPSMNTEITVIAPYARKVLIIAPVHGTAVVKVEKETLELFYQVLKTFKVNARSEKTGD